MNGFITEYAIRVVYTPGQTGRITEYQHHLADARAAYDHASDLHGEEAVEFLTRQVSKTPWMPGKLPPKVDRDGGLCDPILAPARKVRDAGSIDTWQEQPHAPTHSVEMLRDAGITLCSVAGEETVPNNQEAQP